MPVKRQERRVKSQAATVALRASSGARLPRRGVTLIELLIVIMIISILAALILGVAAVAGETARQAQTKHVVERLHTLLTEFYGTFKSRRVPANLPTNTPGQVGAALRLSALRETMRMELPDRWSDVVGARVDTELPGQVLTDYPKFVIPLLPSLGGPITIERTGLANVYLRRYAGLKSTDPLVIRANQGAECLYMIITLACGDGEARSQFKEADIGDTDGDGAPEFLDGWGNPITFVRWPFGFESVSDLMTGDPITDHDPFDPFRVHPDANVSPRPGARLFPLIVSAGRDELYDLVTDSNDGFVYGFVDAPFTVRGTTYTVPILNPYANVLSMGSTNYQMGDEIDTDNRGFGEGGNGDMNHADDIHNHLLGQR